MASVQYSSGIPGLGKNGPGKNGPGKNGPGKNSPEKTVRGGYWISSRIGKNGPFI